MKFYNIYFETGENKNGEIVNRQLRDVESYIDFGDGRVSKFIYSNIQKSRKKEEKINKECNVVIKEYSKGDCVSIHIIMVRKEVRTFDEILESIQKLNKEMNELLKG